MPALLQSSGANHPKADVVVTVIRVVVVTIGNGQVVSAIVKAAATYDAVRGLVRFPSKVLHETHGFAQ